MRARTVDLHAPKAHPSQDGGALARAEGPARLPSPPVARTRGSTVGSNAPSEAEATSSAPCRTARRSADTVPEPRALSLGELAVPPPERHGIVHALQGGEGRGEGVARVGEPAHATSAVVPIRTRTSRSAPAARAGGTQARAVESKPAAMTIGDQGV